MLLSRPHSCPSSPIPSSRPFLPVISHGLSGVSPRNLPSRCRIQATLSSSQEVLPKSAIQRVAEKLRSLGYLEEKAEEDARARTVGRPGGTSTNSPGEIFIPTPQELPRRRVGHTIDSSWSTPNSPVPVPGSGSAIVRFHELRRELGMDTGRVSPTPRPPMVVELTLPPEELRRLRSLGIRLDKKLRLKVGRSGITEGIVNSIHERWRRSELVKIKCEDLCRMNMKRTHETLERKTGGLVIWRSGTIIILYRGADYKYPYFTIDDSKDHDSDKSLSESTVVFATDNEEEVQPSFSARMVSSHAESCTSSQSFLVAGVGSPNKVRFQLPGEVQLGEEADKLLEGLGPRFTDWWGCHPLPVDADLLPAVVPWYRKPFRLLPFGLKPKLTDREMTILRRLGRPLPSHFVLGRNRNLQGLALSMIRLWEKCEIAKIAVKRVVRNTNTELIVEELKRLTGGTLLSRDKDYIIFYRGKDFLPSAVSSAIEQRRSFEMHRQTHKLVESSSSTSRTDTRLISIVNPTSGTKLSKTGAATTNELEHGTERNTVAIKANRLKESHQAVEKVQERLSRALEKKEKAEKQMEKLEQSIGVSKSELDKEAISEEERFMLRKVGLRMKAFLLVGRRGVFDGTVENMHLHWKYRELVKIISRDRCAESVYKSARILEAASGGILVAVERVNRGYAIIVYRGKNYRRPAVLRPRTLLNKKEALKRSLVVQRHQSLKLHVLKLSGDIEKMNHQLERTDGNCALDHENSNSSVETVSQSDSIEDNCECISEEQSSSLSSICYNSSLGKEQSHQSPLSNSVLVYQKEDMKEECIDKFLSNEVVLSNKERLTLRKQALKMKRQPIFAIGRNNAITGVARAINAHLEKYPLAIVNVKGRAKGTSVQELVFQLEQATEAVMVSREPSKVILYRGLNKHRPLSVEKNENSVGTCGSVSPQLMTAISLEYGLPTSQDEDITPPRF